MYFTHQSEAAVDVLEGEIFILDFVCALFIYDVTSAKAAIYARVTAISIFAILYRCASSDFFCCSTNATVVLINAIVDQATATVFSGLFANSVAYVLQVCLFTLLLLVWLLSLETS